MVHHIKLILLNNFLRKVTNLTLNRHQLFSTCGKLINQYRTKQDLLAKLALR